MKRFVSSSGDRLFQIFRFDSRFDQVDRLTIYSNILIEAENLKQVDRDYRNHLQAYSLTSRQTAKKNVGKTKQNLYHLISLLNSLIT